MNQYKTNIICTINDLPEWTRKVYCWFLTVGWHRFSATDYSSNVTAQDAADALNSEIQAVNAALNRLADVDLVGDEDYAGETRCFVYSCHDLDTDEHNDLLRFRDELMDDIVEPKLVKLRLSRVERDALILVDTHRELHGSDKPAGDLHRSVHEALLKRCMIQQLRTGLVVITQDGRDALQQAPHDDEQPLEVDVRTALAAAKQRLPDFTQCATCAGQEPYRVFSICDKTTDPKRFHRGTTEGMVVKPPKPVKLSAQQMTALRRMQSYSGFGHAMATRHIRTNTLGALERRGLAKRINGGWNVGITDAGRAVLDAEQASSAEVELATVDIDVPLTDQASHPSDTSTNRNAVLDVLIEARRHAAEAVDQAKQAEYRAKSANAAAHHAARCIDQAIKAVKE